jgi:hypothetical protein
VRRAVVRGSIKVTPVSFDSQTRVRERELLLQYGGQTVRLICGTCGRRLDVLHVQQNGSGTFYSVLTARQSRWGTRSMPGFERNVEPPLKEGASSTWGCHPDCKRRYTRGSRRVYDVCVAAVDRGRDRVVLGVDL